MTPEYLRAAVDRVQIGVAASDEAWVATVMENAGEVSRRWEVMQAAQMAQYIHTLRYLVDGGEERPVLLLPHRKWCHAPTYRCYVPEHSAWLSCNDEVVYLVLRASCGSKKSYQGGALKGELEKLLGYRVQLSGRTGFYETPWDWLPLEKVVCKGCRIRSDRWDVENYVRDWGLTRWIEGTRMPRFCSKRCKEEAEWKTEQKMWEKARWTRRQCLRLLKDPELCRSLREESEPPPTSQN